MIVRTQINIFLTRRRSRFGEEKILCNKTNLNIRIRIG